MTLLAESRFSLAVSAPTRALNYLAPTAFVTDFVAVCVAGAAATLGRDQLGIFDASIVQVSDTLGLAGPLMMGGWLLVLWLVGAYSSDVFGAGTDEYKRVLNASVLAAGLVGVGAYLAKFQLSRGFFLLLFTIGVPTLILGRFLLRRALYAARTRGALQQRVVIAGTPSHVDEVARVLRRETWLGYDVVGALVPSANITPATRDGVPVIGTPTSCCRRSRWPTPTSSSSPGARSTRPASCAGSPGSSRSTTSRSSWRRASRTSPPSGSGSARSAGCRSCTSTSRGRYTPRGPASGPSTSSGRSPCWCCSRPLLIVAAVWVKLHDRGPVLFAPGADRPRRVDVPLLQVPLDGGRRRGSGWPTCTPGPATGTASSRWRTTRGSPGPAAGCAATPSTSCPSSSTCSAAR